MPIICEWLDPEQTTLFLHLDGKLDAADFLGSEAQIIAHFESVPHLVDVIIDYREQVYFSPDYVDTTNKITLEHPKLRSVIFLGNRLAWELFDLYTRSCRNVSFIYAYAPSLEKAQSILRRIRAGKHVVSRRPRFPDLN